VVSFPFTARRFPSTLEEARGSNQSTIASGHGAVANKMLDYPPGWTCKRTTVELERYLLDLLLLREALALAEHLEACPECFERLAVFRLTLVEHPRG
jgi:hypothetical protein